MKHNYSLQNSKLKPFKLIILAAALVFDFANIWVFISGIVERNVPRILQALGVFLALLLVRVGSTFLTCRHDYNFDQTKLVVSKVFPYLRPKPVVIEYDKIDNIRLFVQDNKSKKAIWLCSKPCHFDFYMIEMK